MYFASILAAMALVGAILVGMHPHNTIDGCSRAALTAYRLHSAGVIHQCDGLSRADQNEALRRAGLGRLN
jgi:hypothetical protein